MTRAEAVEYVQRRFRELEDPEFHKGEARFFKHEVLTRGVRTKDLQTVVREVYPVMKGWTTAERNGFCVDLWKTGALEDGVLVCHVYRRFARQCGACEFRLFERWVGRYVHNWAHCDGVSTWLIGACIRNEPGLVDELLPWTRSRNVWKRRSAAVSLVPAARRGEHTERIFEIAQALAGDSEDMVRKGLGWLLKEAYPKRPEVAVAFLEEYGSGLSRLVLRIAAEKMGVEDRGRVLG